MMDEQSVIGIDGGGSKTEFVWVRRDGQVLSTARKRGSNYQDVGIDGLNGLLEEVLSLWLTSANREGPACICLGLAGAGRPDEQRTIVESLLEKGWADRVRVENDARIALAGAHGGKGGVIAIAGTGSIVFGMGQNGNWVRAGGWGPLLGDEAGAYDIAMRALRTVLAAHDGSGPETLLSRTLLAELGLRGWTELVGRVYGGDLDRSALARLAPTILRCAEGGDRVAVDVVRSAADGLAGQIAAVTRRLGIDREDALSYTGGLLTCSPSLRVHIEEALRYRGVSMRLRAARLPPVLGAVLLAWERVGSPLDESELNKLEVVATELYPEA